MFIPKRNIITITNQALKKFLLSSWLLPLNNNPASFSEVHSIQHQLFVKMYIHSPIIRPYSSDGRTEDCHLAALGSIPASAKSKLFVIVLAWSFYWTILRSSALTNCHLFFMAHCFCLDQNQNNFVHLNANSTLKSNEGPSFKIFKSPQKEAFKCRKETNYFSSNECVTFHYFLPIVHDLCYKL